MRSQLDLSMAVSGPNCVDEKTFPSDSAKQSLIAVFTPFEIRSTMAQPACSGLRRLGGERRFCGFGKNWQTKSLDGRNMYGLVGLRVVSGAVVRFD